MPDLNIVAYAQIGPIFPCREGAGRKAPYTPRGFKDASRDPALIEKWWRRWPNALVGLATGQPSRLVVLDIDVKDPRANGFDSLEDLGIDLPSTPMAHTPSGGLHVYFYPGDRELKNSAGVIGPGLDVRGDGGYIILPSEGSGYYWDPVWNLDSCAVIPAPAWLRPEVKAPIHKKPLEKPVTGLDAYGEAAINSAYNAIVRAPAGRQETTLNAESFAIGTLVGAGGLPEDLALQALLAAGKGMPDHDSRFPWRMEEIDLKVRRAFEAGMARPRSMRRG